MEPPRGIAIIGMACRFPGAPDLGAFWDLLRDGREGIRHFTDDELIAAGVAPDDLTEDYVRAAPVIEGHDLFDAGFFEYSPREARIMDPQQRLLLETAYHAIEDAGLDPTRAGGPVGAFMGSGGVVTSYLLAQAGLHGGATGGIEHLGNDKDFVSTKLSYKLGLTGPSFNVQTACSTSLVAVHLARQSILDGECRVALAGASTVRVPHLAGYRYRQGDILSPDGHCRAYDAQAQGTVFGSGVGVVVLKHVEDALEDGDRVYAVIKGTAINNDGAEKTSYTASSTEGQARCMVEAFGVAEIDPRTIGMIEGHGTGTVVGDPLEVQALNRVLHGGAAWLGSVKTNIGHLEQTAGVASLIKTALALHQGEIPASLNFRTPNARAGLDTGPLRVATENTPWPEGPRRAAVNALGLGGTNAFAVLEQAPDATPEATAPAHVLTLSARSPEALSAMADGWRTYLADLPGDTLAASCFTQANRPAHPHRLSVAGRDGDALARALTTAKPVRAAGARKIAFVFPGQGAQYPGMGAGLYRDEPVFRAAFDRVADAMGDLVDVRVALTPATDPAVLADTTLQQPAIFAIEFALAELMHSWGVAPDMVLGHSVGAFAAAAVAGIWTPEDAARLIAARGRLMGALPTGGAMTALFTDRDTAEGLCDGIDGASVATINSPLSTVIAGTTEAVAQVEARAGDIAWRRLPVSHAFHTPLMAPAAVAFADLVAETDNHPPRLPFVSDASAEVLGVAPDARYWADHMLTPVRFEAALDTLTSHGITDLVEAGPGKALRSFAAAHDRAGAMALHGLLDPEGDDLTQAMGTLGGLWTHGCAVDPATPYRKQGAQRGTAPLYPFQRKRYWLDAAGGRPVSGRLLGEALQTPDPARQFQATWSADRMPWLPDHRVYGATTLPVAAAMILLAEAGEAAGTPAEVTGLTYHKGCIWTEDESRLLHIAAQPDGTATLSSLGDAWDTHITATLSPANRVAGAGDLEHLRTACRDEIAPGDFYRVLDGIGLNYGPGFRNVRALWLGPDQALARLSLMPETSQVRTALHPALLDAALHLFPALSGEHGRFDGPPGEATYLPISVDRFRLLAAATPELWSHCRLCAPREADRFTLDVRLYSPDGTPVAEIDGLTVKKLTRAQFLPPSGPRIDDWLYGIEWQTCAPLPAPAEAATTWTIVADDPDHAAPLTGGLRAAGATVRFIATETFIDNPGSANPDGGRLDGLILAAALSAPPLMVQDTTGLAAESMRQFHLTKAAAHLLSEQATEDWGAPKLWIVTRGAQAPLPDRLGGEAMQAVLWGHGRVIALEHPGIWGGMIDIDEGTDPDALAREILSPDGEDQIALRDGKRFAPRLMPRPLGQSAEPAPIRGDASYLITGGLGTLGLKTAGWLAERGAGALWLVSRRAPDAEQDAQIETLRETVDVHVVSTDIAEPDQVAALIARIAAKGPALDGVFHCAGLLDDGIMASMTETQYTRVTLPKIEGSWALHQATSDLPLNHFVLYSSILSLIGSMGQLNYVAGNSFQDALVAHRQRLGLPALALNWGPWEDAGLATDAGERGRAIWRARGTDYIPANEGMAVLDQALAHDVDHVGVTLTDWPRFLAQFADVPPLYRALGKAATPASQQVDLSAITASLSDASPEARVKIMIDALGLMAIRHLELDTAPDPQVSLRAAGLDSLMSITLINDIEAAFGPRLPAKALLQGPSVAELAEMVLADMALPDAMPVQRAPVRDLTGQWLVTQTPRPHARMRLFCFPFAGGGSAVFDHWGAAFNEDIEIVAVEPPGRLSRIDEQPVRSVEDFARGLLSQMTPMLDRPYAVLGHCLGGLTLYETLRFLQARKAPMPLHIFVSGARAPSVLRAPGNFEAELEERLQRHGGYRSGMPGHEQDDAVFIEIVRAFGISDSLAMLEEAELRDLILPTVRAEFEMASRYMYIPDRPFPVPISCFRGARDDYVRPVDATIWRKFTSRKFEMFTRDTGHFAIVEDFDFIRRVVEERLLPRCADTA